MKEKMTAILAKLITLSSNGTVRKFDFKKVPGKGLKIDISPGTPEPQELATLLADVQWGMIYNGEPSLYGGKVQQPSITIGPSKCLGTSSSTSDVDELLDFVL